MQEAFKDAITAARNELVVEIARTAEQVLEAKRLRYKVYCEERGFEPGEGGRERDGIGAGGGHGDERGVAGGEERVDQDECDVNAHHVLVRSAATGEVFGTVRLVLSKSDE